MPSAGELAAMPFSSNFVVDRVSVPVLDGLFPTRLVRVIVDDGAGGKWLLVREVKEWCFAIEDSPLPNEELAQGAACKLLAALGAVAKNTSQVKLGKGSAVEAWACQHSHKVPSAVGRETGAIGVLCSAW